MGRGCPPPSRLRVWGSVVSSPSGSGVKPQRKTSLEYLELEKTHLKATNLSYLTFLRHILSDIHMHKITKHKTFTYIIYLSLLHS